MKIIPLFLMALCLSGAVVAHDYDDYGSDVKGDYGRWVCSAICPQRPWRVSTVKSEGYREEVKQAAVDQCNQAVLLKNCISTGCRPALR